MRERVFVALGSNVGPRGALLASARNALSLLPGTSLLAASRVEETAPFGAGPQGPYLNQMVVLNTALGPRTLLDALHSIERALGRVRHARWAARTMDLDIVRYGNRTLTDNRLRLPHPGLGTRDFWQREMRQLQAQLELAA